MLNANAKTLLKQRGICPSNMSTDHSFSDFYMLNAAFSLPASVTMLQTKKTTKLYRLLGYLCPWW